ncbi:hypothetical protein C8R43DRAFT_941382 [Mycena crocata]|nr:hypothetical protein C8R43DRAFT_941382 [Mycena crocata]
MHPDMATLTFRPDSETSAKEPAPPLLQLSRVCRHWAQVATSLWKKCDLTFNSNATDYPRTIQQVTTLLKWREADRLDFRIQIHDCEGWRPVLVSFIAFHALKFRALALRVPYELVASLHMMSPAFINLESFTLLVQSNECPGKAWSGAEQWTGLHNHSRTSTLLQKAPLLRRLKVGAWRDPMIPLRFCDLGTFPLGQLTILSIVESYIECDEFLEILENCPLLEECSVSAIMGSPTHVSTRVPLSYLHKLHILGLSATTDKNLWNRLTTPQLVDLSVTNTCSVFTQIATALVALQWRCGFSLRRLALANVPLPVIQSEMEEFFKVFNTIEDLSLRWERGAWDRELMILTVARALSVPSTPPFLKDLAVLTIDATPDSVAMAQLRSSLTRLGQFQEPLRDITLYSDNSEALLEDVRQMKEQGAKVQVWNGWYQRDGRNFWPWAAREQMGKWSKVGFETQRARPVKSPWPERRHITTYDYMIYQGDPLSRTKGYFLKATLITGCTRQGGIVSNQGSNDRPTTIVA